MEQNVNIELQTTIEDNGMKEITTIKEYGKLYTREHMHLVMYEEKTDDQEKVKNMISIQPDKVSIRRSGAVKMNQIFREGERSENIFHHPYGRIHMDTYTKSIEYHPVDETSDGKLVINYTVNLNGQPSQKHFLVLKITS